MQDEDIDKIIREAASQHHPPYDDTAWNKMEQLLDKHLPQKKDRKRPYFLLLAFLLAGGLFYTFIYPGVKHTGVSDKAIAENNTVPEKNNSNAAPKEPANMRPAGTGINDDVNNTTQNTTTASLDKNVAAPTTVATSNNDYNAGNTSISFSRNAKLKMRIKNANATASETAQVDDNNSKTILPAKQQKQNIAETNDNDIAVTEQVKTMQPATASVLAENNTKKTIPVTKTDAVTEKKKDADKTPTASTNKKENKTKGKVPGNFGITASAGTDLSFINTGSLGKATFIYGAGASYDISKRIKVRAGFYVSKKIYAAKPDEYSGTQYPNLVNIDGNCKVYEIPVAVNYNFGQAKKHNWFAGVGLSSFIMKKEDYQYNYKTASGATYNYKQELNDQNKHLFSVLNLSAGYQYNLSNRVSLMAEPFVKLPLTGIGQGKVKLNSTGILLTATVKPFNKKKK